jgi:hypothetical protein
MSSLLCPELPGNVIIRILALFNLQSQFEEMARTCAELTSRNSIVISYILISRLVIALVCLVVNDKLVICRHVQSRVLRQKRAL